MSYYTSVAVWESFQPNCGKSLILAKQHGNALRVKGGGATVKQQPPPEEQNHLPEEGEEEEVEMEEEEELTNQTGGTREEPATSNQLLQKVNCDEQLSNLQKRFLSKPSQQAGLRSTGKSDRRISREDKGRIRRRRRGREKPQPI